MQRVLVFIFLLCVPSGGAVAQELFQELQEVVTADVVSIENETERPIMGTGATATVQTVRAKITSGQRENATIVFENDLVTLESGDRIFLNRLVTIEDDEYFVLKDVDRRAELVWLGVLFVVLMLWFAGWQGMRALVSLGVSIAAILFILIPLLLAGYNPALVSLGIAGIILAAALFGTHGINARTALAFGGAFCAVLMTVIIAHISVSAMRLTGFGSDASVYLNFSTSGSLDFAGLLLGGIIIGLLGVLDDVSITQASVVQELKAANRTFGFWELYTRSIRVGRDHVGSLVNTLALAYVGVSLPLVLLLAHADAALSLTLNQEVVAAELARIIIGSIGLILAVPLTTVFAAWWFGTHDVDAKDISSHGHHRH